MEYSLVVFFVDTLSSNALKKVYGHCGIICLVEHCVEKLFWSCTPFCLGENLCVFLPFHIIVRSIAVAFVGLAAA